MNTQLEDRLKAHLDEQARGLIPDGAGAEAALRDGRRIRRRRTIFNSLAAVVLLVVGIGGAFTVRAALAGDPGDDVPLAEGELPGEGSEGVGGAVTPGPALAALDWYGVEPTIGLARKLFAGDDGAIYALSTAPGSTWENLSRALYRTDDGETWSVALVDEGFGMSDIDEFRGTLYAVGTGPGFSTVEASAAEFTVSTSEDGGETWDTSVLPVTAAPPPDLGNINWVDASAHVAAGPSGTVAVTATRYQVDLMPLLPADLRFGNVDVQPTDTGIQAIDYSIYEQLDMQCSEEMAGGDMFEVPEEDLPESCRQLLSGQPEAAIVFSATWEELGYEAGNPLSFLEVFVAPNGGDFEAVPSPFGADEWIRGVYAVDDGFMSLSWGRNSSIARFSRDGRSWTEVSGLPVMADVVQVGVHGGRTVLVGNSRDGRPLVAVSEDGATWVQADLDDVLEDVPGNAWLSATAIGEQGVVFAVNAWDEVTQRSSISLIRGNGLDQWEVVPLEELLGTGDGYVEWLAVGKDHIVGRVLLASQFGPQTNLQLVGSRP